LGRAKGSAGELRAQLYIALDRKYLSQDQFDTTFRLVETCSKQLARLMQYLETQPITRRVQEGAAVYNLEPSTLKPIQRNS
jgi:hypothetical protein